MMTQMNSFLLGEIALNEGRLDDAFLHFADATDTTPLALVKLSEVVAKEGNLAHAIYLLQQAISDPRQRPSFYQKTKLYIDCGNYYKQMGQLNLAIEQYALALELDPLFQRRFGSLVMTKEIQDEIIVKVFNTIEKQEKNNLKKEKEKEKLKEKKIAKQKLAEECFQKGEKSFQQRNYSEAIGFYRQAIEQNAQHWNAHVKLCQSVRECAFSPEKLASALKSCEAMINIASQPDYDKSDLALAYCEKGNVQFFLAANEALPLHAAESRKKAQKNFERAIKENASLGMAYFGIAKCFMRQAVSKCDEFDLLLESVLDVSIVEKKDAEMVALYEQAENYFMVGIEKFGAEAVLPPDIYWELGQLKDGQNDLEGGQKFYALAFQGNRDVFCTLYLDRINKEFPLNALTLLNKYSFILHNKEFNAYLKECGIPGEKAGIYFRYGVLCKQHHKPRLAIQQLLLAFVHSVTEQQNKYVCELMNSLEQDVGRSIFQNISHELTTEELESMKAGYILWIQTDLKEAHYETAIGKYELIEDEVTFQALYTADFLASMGQAYAKTKNIENALKCYRRAADINPDDEGINAKIKQLIGLRDLKLQHFPANISEENKFYAQGNANFLLKKYDAALEYYRQAIAINPKHGRAHIGMAKCYRRLGEAKMRPSRFEIIPALLGSDYISEVAIVQPEDERCLYELSEEHFLIGLQLVGAPEKSEIYREMACLYELRGNYRKGAAYFEKSFNDDKEKLYEFYRKLTAQEFEKMPLPFHLVYRFEFLLHDAEFEVYYTQHNAPAEYKSGLYLDCGYIYDSYSHFDCAVQQYLLALSCSQSESQAEKAYASLDRVLSSIIQYEKSDISFSIFQNILNLTTDEELTKIKQAYIQWMNHDLKKKDYPAAVKKFMLLVDDESSHVLIGAKFLCHMGVACAKSDLDLAIACYAAAYKVDPGYKGIEPNRTILLDKKALRDQEKPTETEDGVYVSNGRSSPVMYKKDSYEGRDVFNADSSCIPF